MRLCSACLLGIRCRYDGRSNTNEQVIAISQKEILIPICPEQLGGQPTPRPNAEIIGGDGRDVIEGNAKVLETDGTDVSTQFINGANEVLTIAKLYHITEAILAHHSPSCGCGIIYDGTFSKKKINGDGVTTALLKKNGIHVLSDTEL